MGRRVSAGLGVWYIYCAFGLSSHAPLLFSSLRSSDANTPPSPRPHTCVKVTHAAEAEALETSVVDREEENEEQEKGPRGVTYPSGLNLPFGDEDLDQDRDADGNNRRRHLRKNSDNNSDYNSNSNGKKNSRHRRYREGSTSPAARRSRRRAAAEGHRRLEREVSEGMEAARIRDPDVDAKDEDLRLLGEYLAAGPPEQEAFHERGVRRLSSEETQMPSGRVLASSTTIDVMVLYTADAMVSSGKGTLLTDDRMETEIDAHFATANDALADSGIDAIINLVHVQQASDVSLLCLAHSGAESPHK